MEDVTRDLFVSIAVIGCIFGIAYLFFTTRHRERMSMLEKGVDPTIFTGKTASYTLKIGMLAVGLATGILVGGVIDEADWINRGMAYISMTFMFGGFALILNYLVDRRK